MSLNLALAFSLSIFIAGIIAVLRFKKISSTYYPFLFCVWIACINEALSVFLIKHGHQTAINNNLYVLLESVLLLFLFKNFNLFNKTQWLFNSLLVIFTGVWLAENFVTGKITSITNYFRIIYSFATILMSINILNRLLVKSDHPLSTNSVFILCSCFIIYYTYKVLIYAFWLYGLNASSTFLLRAYIVLLYINLFTNLLFALAVLWMPRKRGYILP